ncbi:hypothetical protein [Candidatus Nitrospira allomarina]|uniref:Uncharacterized protein n=1 Tax=Candidatus Nitrospira allomarina TaxID=3020900 RepID=A0AA96GE80_9BACT|nr:hypothetical protein [Candidatus Nitrospira allomarina]WNM60036.1 hypothetical protein PP769_09850 [Candidatus Nitrospira allomarina]
MSCLFYTRGVVSGNPNRKPGKMHARSQASQGVSLKARDKKWLYLLNQNAYDWTLRELFQNYL